MEVFGVSFDTPEDNRAFAEKFDFPYPLLCDTERRLGVAYGAADDETAAHARRITVVVDPEGRVAAVHEQVDPASHPEQLLASL